MNTNYLLIGCILFVAIYLWPRNTSTKLDKTQDSDDDDEQIFINPFTNDTRI